MQGEKPVPCVAEVKLAWPPKPIGVGGHSLILS